MSWGAAWAALRMVSFLGKSCLVGWLAFREGWSMLVCLLLVCLSVYLARLCEKSWLWSWFWPSVVSPQPLWMVAMKAARLALLLGTMSPAKQLTRVLPCYVLGLVTSSSFSFWRSITNDYRFGCFKAGSSLCSVESTPCCAYLCSVLILFYIDGDVGPDIASLSGDIHGDLVIVPLFSALPAGLAAITEPVLPFLNFLKLSFTSG